MNIERTIERLQNREYQSVGHQVGREMAFESGEKLMLLRAALSGMASVEGLYANGYRAALDHVLAGWLVATDAYEE